mmetsp:Transcript_27386/g.74876  ORF Transcript_27386/g.74876 Transcript_27386/m.74876 type:complete len:233 (-) Transcript_27386:34-732(-)
MGAAPGRPADLGRSLHSGPVRTVAVSSRQQQQDRAVVLPVRIVPGNWDRDWNSQKLRVVAPDAQNLVAKLVGTLERLGGGVDDPGIGLPGRQTAVVGDLGRVQVIEAVTAVLLIGVVDAPAPGTSVPWTVPAADGGREQAQRAAVRCRGPGGVADADFLGGVADAVQVAVEVGATAVGSGGWAALLLHRSDKSWCYRHCHCKCYRNHDEPYCERNRDHALDRSYHDPNARAD